MKMESGEDSRKRGVRAGPYRQGLKEMAGFADGIRADTDGNIWVGGGWVGDGYDGVHVFSPDGERIGLILLPEICSNVCFGGEKRNRLFMTPASRSTRSTSRRRERTSHDSIAACGFA